MKVIESAPLMVVLTALSSASAATAPGLRGTRPVSQQDRRLPHFTTFNGLKVNDDQFNPNDEYNPTRAPLSGEQYNPTHAPLPP